MIRKATIHDLSRIIEIIIFNYRLNFYKIFKNDDYYFNELTVLNQMDKYKKIINEFYVYDDGVIKGIIQIHNQEVIKLFVEPIFQNQKIGSQLLTYAIDNFNVNHLWVLEKNHQAISFYKTHGFIKSDEWKYEEDTTEKLLLVIRKN